MAPKKDVVETITITGGKPDKNPSIPASGQIQFTNNDNEYMTLEWQDEHGNQGTFWNPQPIHMPHGNNKPQTAQDLARGKNLKYQFNGGKKIREVLGLSRWEVEPKILPPLPPVG